MAVWSNRSFPSVFPSSTGIVTLHFLQWKPSLLSIHINIITTPEVGVGALRPPRSGRAPEPPLPRTDTGEASCTRNLLPKASFSESKCFVIPCTNSILLFKNTAVTMNVLSPHVPSVGNTSQRTIPSGFSESAKSMFSVPFWPLPVEDVAPENKRDAAWETTFTV